MIRRKRRTVQQEALLAYKRMAPCAIGASLDEVKAQAAALEVATIVAVHDYIWATRYSCQLCRGRRKAECLGLPDEMHEDPPRSATRGLPPAERFNLVVCGRLCHACHRDVTENRLRVVFANPALGFIGPVSAEPVS